MGVLRLILFILELVTAWKVFEKYGEAGWKGLIPFYSDYIEFGKVWSVTMGIAYIVVTVISIIPTENISSLLISILVAAAAIASFVINIMFAIKKAKAFGGKIGLILLLIFFPFIGNLYIGFGKNVEYIGPQA